MTAHAQIQQIITRKLPHRTPMTPRPVHNARVLCCFVDEETLTLLLSGCCSQLRSLLSCPGGSSYGPRRERQRYMLSARSLARLVPRKKGNSDEKTRPMSQSISMELGVLLQKWASIYTRPSRQLSSSLLWRRHTRWAGRPAGHLTKHSAHFDAVILSREQHQPGIRHPAGSEQLFNASRFFPAKQTKR